MITAMIHVNTNRQKRWSTSEHVLNVSYDVLSVLGEAWKNRRQDYSNNKNNVPSKAIINGDK